MDFKKRAKGAVVVVVGEVFSWVFWSLVGYEHPPLDKQQRQSLIDL